MLRTAVDIGGTFTDVVAFDDQSGEILFGKGSTTPQNLVEGVLRAIHRTGTNLADAGLLIHGSTVVINAILERKGATTALVTTRGFRDIYEIGRINRPDSFNLFFRKHVPLIPRECRFEVSERVDAQGDVLVALDEDEARRLARQLGSDGVEAVAVLFLHSYRNPGHEVRMQEILRQEAPHLFVSVSHEISREYREYERTSTVAANAYVGPKVRSYIDELESRARAEGFAGTLLMLQSNGGLCDPDLARTQCIQMLESGPAAGVTGANALCTTLGIQDAITFDMGGTTAKACVIEGNIPRSSSDFFVGGYFEGLALRIPALEIKEVGTGGGSIARVDEDGRLLVGPESAGAEPGPACYGRGGVEPTVTDADLLLGRIDVARHLGGEIQLDRDLAERAIRDRVSGPLGLALPDAALGILKIANAKMSYAVQAVTTERGLDPRDFVMLAFGGGGPLHAVEVAKELHIPTVVVPPAPALFSALGMLLADLRRDYVRTHFTRLKTADLAELERIYREMAVGGLDYLGAITVPVEAMTVIRSADMRYSGQEHSVTVAIPDDVGSEPYRAQIKAAFDEAHQLRYSHSAPEEEAEVVSLRVSVVASVRKPPFRQVRRGAAAPPDTGRLPDRTVFFEELGGFVRCPVFAREALLSGNLISGPALVEEYGTTTLLAPGDSLRVDDLANLVITVNVND